MYDLCIRNGRLVTEAGVWPADVYVREGKISALTDGDRWEAGEIVDAGGCYVFPGAVDAHVHFNDPGHTESEDFFTGSRAAAAGGVTCVMEMPQTVPVVADAESFRGKLAEAERKSVVDFGLYLALTPENIADVEELCQLRPVGFKCFLSHSDEIGMLDDGMLYLGMQAVRRAGSRLSVHAENQSLIDVLTAELRSRGRRDPLAHAEARPPLVELTAVQRTAALARETGAAVHIAHCSLPEAVDVVSQTRRCGHPVTVETAPHYLLLSLEALGELGPYAKCNPPLRSDAVRRELWRRLSRGDVDMIASDHAPFTFAEKEAGSEDIWSAPSGLTAVQTMVPLVLSEGRRRGLSWRRLARLLCTGPARVFGLYPQKGSLRVGADADMFLFDPDASTSFRAENLWYKEPWTPFEDWTVKGRVVRTWIRGGMVFDGTEGEKGRIRVDRGYGRFVWPVAPGEEDEE
ncbi:MAG: allantoinase AllB [Bacillota bacterium]